MHGPFRPRDDTRCRPGARGVARQREWAYDPADLESDRGKRWLPGCVGMSRRVADTTRFPHAGMP